MSQATLLFHQPDETAEASAAAPPAVTRSRIVLFAGLTIAILVWFAPALLARSGLRHQLVHAVLPSYPGEASVGRASLGWLSPIVLEQLELRDLRGDGLLHVEEFRTSKTLFSLLVRRTQGLGTLTLTRPRLTMRLTAEGSNLEDALRPLLAESGSGSTMTVLVVDGQCHWTEIGEATGRAGLEAIAASFERSGPAASAFRLELDAQVTDGEHRGSFTLRSAGGKTAASPQQLSCVAQDLPFEAFQPWCDRFLPGLDLAGTGSADVVVTLPANESPWRFDGRVTGRRMRLSCPGPWQGSPLLVEEVSLAGRGALAGSLLTIEKGSLQSDLLNATATGSIDVASLSATTLLQQLEGLLSHPLTLHATADVARLATALPQSLRLRQPLRSGTLTFDLNTANERSEQRGVVRLHASDVTAGPADHPIVWKKPLSFDLAVRRSDSGIVVEEARIDSEFLQVEAAGAADHADVRFTTDLDRLRDLASRFMEIPAGTLAGRAEGGATIRSRDRDGTFDVAARATIHDLQLDLARRTWTERELVAEAQAGMAIAADRLTFESGSVSLRSVEGDEARVELKQPAVVAELPSGHFTVSTQGNARRWVDRARGLGLLSAKGDWSLDGEIKASADVTASNDRLRATQVHIDSQNFRLRTRTQAFDESYLRLEGDCDWNRAASEVTLAAAKLDCESAAIGAKGVIWSLDHSLPHAGQFELRGGIGRLARYVLPARPPVWVSGVVTGTVTVTGEPQATGFKGNIGFERPLVTAPAAVAGGAMTWLPVWSDEAANIRLAGRYHRLTDALDIASFDLSTTGLSLQGKGHIDQLTTRAIVDLSGTTSYDWPMLAKRFPAWPQAVTVLGQGAKPFLIRGPLMSHEGIDPVLSAEAGTDWASLDAWGMSIGSGQLKCRLDRKTLEIGPFNCVAAKGRIQGNASVFLDSPWPLRVAPGKIATDIELSPAVCRTWLRFAAPMLADATTVEGKASLGLASCVVPLSAPTAMQSEATLLVENLDATPGPLARSLIDVVGQIQQIAGRDATQGSDLRLVAPRQAVAVKVNEGRVFHDRFAAQLGDSDGPTLTTSGSVGFDESLDLVVTVPLDPKWFRDERIATALGGQTLRIPVRGTLSRPTPDPRALQDFARRAATGAVNGLLNRELEKQIGDPLRKLLDRP